MDTRPKPNITGKPFTRRPFPKKTGDNNFGEKSYQPRDNRFQPRGDRFQDRDNRFQKTDGKYNPRNDRFQTNRRFPPKGKGLKPWEKDNRPRIVSDLQISDGKHRGKYLQNTASAKVRMTPRRIREALFKILYRRIRAGRFLDLCAGIGTVGIEAISRGAMIGTFVERSAKLCSLIKKNVETSEIKVGHAEIIEGEIVPFMKKMAKRRRYWDVVFFDPPAEADNEEILKYLSRGICVKPNGILVIEHHSDKFFSEKIGVLKRWRVAVQGETTLSFYERKL
ncbi:hypothetical protein BH10ACI1_BH10ACI1_35810 [soil metagenome]